ncbi:UDP-N-acetylmuramoyl-tripeptide--D-alanyl-D-alanine ligase [Thermoflavifilum thermophilum]|uniref:UDP-N-acetylmuramoyl-tripeptide--D-alanyl-D-alanine ligase n=1 Tax=Thermoflavifilum thermophilum TaxID=1393122 RepID=A0A1I7N608_9BACT|nr:UDP-N-acetylmuramoyl-tripeptide--D-alanyl-D-alanine ligase [Thermoflavifilum thermophilum]SFV30117.1 UDP-N-acetylmuramoyl-tripeptide--D-alanyl-D-alanine ligase [Thermoflavifilum thermophilum]
MISIPELYAFYRQHPHAQTDSRKLQPGEIFFALKGPRYDGHEFVAAALEKGASYVVVDRPEAVLNDRCLLVADTLRALQLLARHHRMQQNIPFLAIGGSNGKTTTKELIRSVLSTTYQAYATPGNWNNHIGIPLTLLAMPPETNIAIIEMGANHIGEMMQYCDMVNPTHGLVTNIGKDHLEGFGSIEGVKKAYNELFDYLRITRGTAFVCQDDTELITLSEGIPYRFTYGASPEARVSGTVVQADPFLQLQVRLEGKEVLIRTQLIGRYNFQNIMAAIAVGLYWGVPIPRIQAGIAEYTPQNNRSQLVEKDGNTYILDAYNANPSSMKAAIENFAALNAEKKILLLGAMKELGAASESEHRELIRLISQYPWHLVALAGEEFAGISHPYLYFPDAASLRNWWKSQHITGAHVLVKGSRSLAMEQVIN